VNTKRIEWIDIIKYICIVMVILSHLESVTEVWNKFFTPFFLTGFFFASGYVYKHKNGFKVFLYKKIRQLLVPWFVFSVFNMILSQITSFNVHNEFLEEFKLNLLQIRGYGDKIWFVAALFMAFIPFYFFIKWFEKSNMKKPKKSIIFVFIAFLLSLVSVLYVRLVPNDIFPWNTNSLPWHLEYIFQAMFYMVLGYVFKENLESRVDLFNNLKNRIVVLVVYMIMVYVPYGMNISMNIVIGIVYTYICQIIGILALILFAKSAKSNRYINYVGQSTLIYFALHGKVYSLLETVMRKIAGEIYTIILSDVVLSSIFAMIMTLAITIILIIPAYIINRWLPFIVGRKQKIQS
jgi:acyltransferase 3